MHTSIKTQYVIKQALQCSCLENPRDGGAWWAAVYGVSQSRTQLKRLSRSSSARKESACNMGDLGWWGGWGEGMLKDFGMDMYAAAAAKLLQLCPTLCDPIDGSPPGSTIPGILQARVLEWVAIAFSNT